MKEDKNRRSLSPNKTLELSPRSEAALTVEISIIQNKFNNNSFTNPQHQRQFSDISHQNLTGYKGIG